jgi:hypothetical protein
MAKTNCSNFDKGRIVQKVADLERRDDENRQEHTRMWNIINKIQSSRPPVWCTAVIGVLLAILGWLARGAWLFARTN